MTESDLAAMEARAEAAGRGTAYAEDVPALIAEIRRLAAESVADLDTMATFERAERMSRACAAFERARAEAAEARVAELESIVSNIKDWTDTYGADISPRGADTYGEGKRDAKDTVRSILRRPRSPAAESQAPGKS